MFNDCKLMIVFEITICIVIDLVKLHTKLILLDH